MQIVSKSTRPFMRPNDLEPNYHYRPWLEEHVGRQGEDWDWEIADGNFNLLYFMFSNLEHCVLFELTWP